MQYQPRKSGYTISKIEQGLTLDEKSRNIRRDQSDISTRTRSRWSGIGESGLDCGAPFSIVTATYLIHG